MTPYRAFTLRGLYLGIVYNGAYGSTRDTHGQARGFTLVHILCHELARRPGFADVPRKEKLKSCPEHWHLKIRPTSVGKNELNDIHSFSSCAYVVKLRLIIPRYAPCQQEVSFLIRNHAPHGITTSLWGDQENIEEREQIERNCGKHGKISE